MFVKPVMAVGNRCLRCNIEQVEAGVCFSAPHLLALILRKQQCSICLERVNCVCVCVSMSVSVGGEQREEVEKIQ